MKFGFSGRIHMRLNPDLSDTRNKARILFETLRREILAGRFSAGEKLPGSRTLAATLGIARGTVNLALAMLAAEGLVEIRAASGTRVAVAAATEKKPRVTKKPRLSPWAKRLPPLTQPGAAPFFAAGRLADEYFPEREWLQAIKEGRRSYGVLSSHVGQSAAGFTGLRRMIAAHLQYSRGLSARPENIAIVNGSMQAITLITQLILGEGDSGVCEDPGFHGIRAAIQASGAKLLTQPLDAQGMTIPEKATRLVVVTPASQFPTGITMSYQRRAALLEYARRHGAFVIEDEYDSEFSRFANPPQPLKLTDHDDRVIYVGSFSRTMFAALRIGYCFLPDALVDSFLRARQLYDSVPPALSDQIAMAAFMQAGHYRRHLKRMNRIYSARHAQLLADFTRVLGHRFEFEPSAAGLSLFARWKGKRSEFNRVQEALEAAGFAWQRTDRYYAEKPPRTALFGFSHLTEAKIGEAADQISRLIR